MNIRQALADIADIRAQLERTQTHRGFRSLAAAVSGLIALATAFGLNRWCRDLSPAAFLQAWMVVACVAVGLAAIEMQVRARWGDAELLWKMHKNLSIQIGPALVVGLVLTISLCGSIATVSDAPGESKSQAGFSQKSIPVRPVRLPDTKLSVSPVPDAMNLVGRMPGMWAMIYGVGLIACVQHLPSTSRYVALYFIVGGCVCIGISNADVAGLNLQMGTLFGMGQMLLAAVLFWNMERKNG